MHVAERGEERGRILAYDGSKYRRLTSHLSHDKGLIRLSVMCLGSVGDGRSRMLLLNGGTEREMEVFQGG